MKYYLFFLITIFLCGCANIQPVLYQEDLTLKFPFNRTVESLLIQSPNIPNIFPVEKNSSVSGTVCIDVIYTNSTPVLNLRSNFISPIKTQAYKVDINGIKSTYKIKIFVIPAEAILNSEDNKNNYSVVHTILCSIKYKIIIFKDSKEVDNFEIADYFKSNVTCPKENSIKCL